MRLKIVILLALFSLVVAGLVTPWGHDFVAIRSTRYAPGFSEQSFRAVRVGDSREQIAALLGQPISTYYIIVRSNGTIPETVSSLPTTKLPADASVQEIRAFSAGKRTRGDFRLVEVILDRSGQVESTRDYVTD